MMYERQPLAKDDTKICFGGHSFKITGVCGYGTSSIVYYAEDTNNSQKVIIKEIYPADLEITRNFDDSLYVPKQNSDIFKKYIKRAEAARDLQSNLYNNGSTNNATSFSFAEGECNKTYYYASECKTGLTLYNWINKNKGKNKAYILELLKICRNIAYVLNEYHKKGYIHLDIKPANILVVPIDEENYYIQMFDFDSVYTLDDLKNNYVRYSPGYAAPEIEYFSEDIDMNRTDIFSVGAILYEGIFGKAPGDEVTEFGFEFDFSEVKALDSLCPELKPKLEEILKKTLSIVVGSRFNADELWQALGESQKIIAESKGFILNMDIRSEIRNIVERKTELFEIHKELTADKKVAYIYGTGGTGKTELALQYAERYRKEYATIHKVTYNESLEKTISDIEISTGKQAIFKEICTLLNNVSTNALIIIDNFEAAKGDSEVLKTLLENSNEKVHFILTSRNKPSRLDGIDNSLCEIRTDELSDNLKRDITKMVFKMAGEKSDKYEEKIKDFIKSIDYHFLTVSLFAELSGDILRTSSDRYLAFLNELKNQGVSSPNICNRNNDIFFNKIKIIFDRNEFTDKEKKIMLNASLLPGYGMPEGEFLQYIGVDVNSTIGNSSACDNLVNGNWLKRETRNKDNYIIMHPIIKEVCSSKFVLKKEKDFDVFKNFIINLNKKLIETWEDKSAYYKQMIKTEHCLDIVNNFFSLCRKAKKCLDNKKIKLSRDMLSNLTDILSYYSYTKQHKEFVKAYNTLMKMDDLKKNIKRSLYVHNVNYYAFYVSELFTDKSSKKYFQKFMKKILAWRDKSVSLNFCDYVNLKITMAGYLFRKDKNKIGLSYVQSALKDILRYFDQSSNTDPKKMIAILRTAIMCLLYNKEDDAKKCLNLLDGFYSKDKEYEYLKSEAVNIFVMDTNYIYLICYCILKGVIDQSLDYVFSASCLLADCVFNRYVNQSQEKVKKNNDNLVKMAYSIYFRYQEGINIPLIDILSALEFKLYSLCLTLCITLCCAAGMINTDEFDDPLTKISAIKENYCFERKDYIHAVQNINSFEVLIPDNYSKDNIIRAYEQEAERYRQVGDNQKSAFYTERADIVRQDYNNRRNILTDLLYQNKLFE